MKYVFTFGNIQSITQFNISLFHDSRSMKEYVCRTNFVYTDTNKIPYGTPFLILFIIFEILVGKIPIILTPNHNIFCKRVCDKDKWLYDFLYVTFMPKLCNIQANIIALKDMYSDYIGSILYGHFLLMLLNVHDMDYNEQHWWRFVGQVNDAQSILCMSKPVMSRAYERRFQCAVCNKNTNTIMLMGSSEWVVLQCAKECDFLGDVYWWLVIFYWCVWPWQKS